MYPEGLKVSTPELNRWYARLSRMTDVKIEVVGVMEIESYLSNGWGLLAYSRTRTDTYYYLVMKGS